MADGQETEIVQTEPGTLKDVLDALNPNPNAEPVSEAEGEPGAPETPEAERKAPVGEGEKAKAKVEKEVLDELEETEEAEAEDDEEVEEEAGSLKVEIGELEIELDSEEAVAAIEELIKEADLVTELLAGRQEMEERGRALKRDADQLAIMEDELRADPVGYLSEKIGAGLRAAVAEDLLLDDEVWSKLVDRLEEWNEDSRLRQVAAERRRADRAEFRNQIAERKVQARAGRENAWELRDAIHEMGDKLPDRARLVWERAALSRLTDHVRKSEQSGKPIQKIDPKDLSRVLADEVEAFGITAGDPSAKPSGQKKPAKDAGEKFRAKTRKRKKVNSMAPTGAGAGPARREQYKDMSLGDALSSLSGQTGR
jgi:hypothetical protein